MTLFYLVPQDDSDSTSDEEESVKEEDKEKQKIQKKLQEKAKTYGIEQQKLRIQVDLDRRRSKRIPVIESYDQTALKKAKTVTNSNLNKTLRPSKSTQLAAHTASNSSKYALANLKMMQANQQAKNEKETIANISNFVQSSSSFI